MASYIQLIYNILFRKQKTKPEDVKPADKEHISKKNIKKILLASLPVKPDVILIGDLNYNMVSEEEILAFNTRFLHWIKEHSISYYKNRFDCDNFARAWSVYLDMDYKFPFEVAGGEIWIYWKEKSEIFGHAVNLYIDKNDTTLKFTEPQTGKPYTLPDNIFKIEKVEF